MTLEQAYYLSQIALTGIAAAAAVGAYVQLQTFKRFELMKVLEDPLVRKARSLLYQQLVREAPTVSWWENNQGLEEAAATVCASFDIVGKAAKGRNRKFFKEQWSHSICWTYEALEKYLQSRRTNNPQVYHAYRDLYKDAKPFDRR